LSEQTGDVDLGSSTTGNQGPSGDSRTKSAHAMRSYAVRRPTSS
jgi:hypothetical protein